MLDMFALLIVSIFISEIFSHFFLKYVRYHANANESNVKPLNSFY